MSWFWVYSVPGILLPSGPPPGLLMGFLFLPALLLSSSQCEVPMGSSLLGIGRGSAVTYKETQTPRGRLSLMPRDRISCPANSWSPDCVLQEHLQSHRLREHWPDFTLSGERSGQQEWWPQGHLSPGVAAANVKWGAWNSTHLFSHTSGSWKVWNQGTECSRGGSLSGHQPEGLQVFRLMDATRMSVIANPRAVHTWWRK